MYTADLHIHSKYSRATSRDCDGPHLDLWARYKGIGLLGTGDFTHPAWRAELGEALEEAEEGLYVLKAAHRLPGAPAGAPIPRFVVSGEISCIYKRHGKTRKVHNLILLPSLAAAEALSGRLAAIGNIHSDGRPILGLDSRDLLEITLSCCPEAVFIPAHIWTPHFSLFGAFSGFDTLEECFGDLSPHIRALETGLSSDPPMNWRVSALDGYTLVSHSDAHSPAKLGREADLIEGPMGYPALARALSTGEGFAGTIEFFPEEGKYHLDGHRACGVRLTPAQTAALGYKCPVCGRKLTIGVEHRAEALADRPQGFTPPGAKPFESLAPLPEVIAASGGFPVASKKTQAAYFGLLAALGPEFYILREAPLEAVQKAGGELLAEGLRRLRLGQVKREAGYDGVYGTVSLFDEGERELLGGQTALLDLAAFTAQAGRSKAAPSQAAQAPEKPGPAPGPAPIPQGLNPGQRAAAETEAPALAVVAGPGTGKTSTLVARILYLIREKGVRPAELTAVTFTNLAAAELRERITAGLGGKRNARGLSIGTFHALCLNLLPPKTLLGREEALALLRQVMAERGDGGSPVKAQEAIGNIKAGIPCPAGALPPGLYEAYEAALTAQNARDLDGLLLEALAVEVSGHRAFTHLLVDEFQDINPIQRRLVLHWSRAGKSLFVIGDPDQSIYGFRGASADCFAALSAEIPGLQTLALSENYRSTPQILEAAGALIQHNGGGPRPLRPNLPPGPPVRLLQAPTPFAEAVWVAKEIGRLAGGVDMLEAGKAAAEQPRAFSDMAVLCRTHRQLDLIESCLRHDSIPCVVAGREDYLLDEGVGAALGFFRSLLRPGDTGALGAYLKTAWGCPADLIGRAARLYGAMAAPDIGALREALQGFGHLALWLDEAEAYLPRIQKEKPRRLVEDWAKAHGPSEALERLANAAAFHDTLAGFLQTLALGAEGDIRRASGKSYASGAVRLMTLHGAKGLEFPVVFVAGLRAGALPLERAGAEVDEAEERRLLYVGMTRAREELALTGSGALSPFAAELLLKAGRLPARERRAEQLTLLPD